RCIFCFFLGCVVFIFFFFFFSSRRRHTRLQGDWSSDVCSSDLARLFVQTADRFACLLRLSQMPSGACLLRFAIVLHLMAAVLLRSEERRVGKECRYRWLAEYLKKKREREMSTAAHAGEQKSYAY